MKVRRLRSAALSKNAKILLIDDDPGVLRALTRILTKDGYEVTALSDPVEGLTVARDPDIDVVVCDIQMPVLSGIDLLKAYKQVRPDVEFIMMTGNATIETAMQAVRAGAYDYLPKPFERMEDFSLTVAKAVERRALKARAEVLEDALSAKVQYEGMIGQSPQMNAVFKLVETVSASTATVLIRGESGTGKELVAKALHFRSARKSKPFIAVNCSALTSTLLDSELFGHVKGAFTGAVSNKRGLFEAADGGSIFLDEIGDVPPATQVRLLRVLQEGEIKRVGGTESVGVDVRVIAATNVDLERAKSEGRFREDLYYRLNVIALNLPPLRDRPSDVPLLAQYFLKQYSEKFGKQVTGFSPGALERLVCNRWTGNVRELENAVERAVVLTQGEVVDIDDLPPQIRDASRAGGGGAEFFSLAHLPFAQAKTLTINAFERLYLATTMERSGNNVTAASLAAGMDRSNFRRLLKEHDIAGRPRPAEPGTTGRGDDEPGEN